MRFLWFTARSRDQRAGIRPAVDHLRQHYTFLIEQALVDQSSADRFVEVARGRICGQAADLERSHAQLRQVRVNRLNQLVA